MLKWIKYSGAAVIFTLNPCWWPLLPRAQKDYNEWAGPNEWSGSVRWLFLTIRVWIDDGSW
jgi:hypothetical protein